MIDCLHSEKSTYIKCDEGDAPHRDAAQREPPFGARRTGRRVWVSLRSSRLMAMGRKRGRQRAVTCPCPRMVGARGRETRQREWYRRGRLARLCLLKERQGCFLFGDDLPGASRRLSSADGGKGAPRLRARGCGFPRQFENWLGMTTQEADASTSLPPSKPLALTPPSQREARMGCGVTPHI